MNKLSACLLSLTLAFVPAFGFAAPSPLTMQMDRAPLANGQPAPVCANRNASQTTCDQIGTMDANGVFHPVIPPQSVPSSAMAPNAFGTGAGSIAAGNDPRFTVVSATDLRFGTLYGDGQQLPCTVSTVAGSRTLSMSGTGCSFGATDAGKILRITGAGPARPSGFLGSVPVTNPGAGFSSVPAVAVAGGNGNASARAIMALVATPTIVSGGAGYLGGGSGSIMLAVAQQSPTGGHGRPAVVSATVTNGVITAITGILDPGAYLNPPNGTWSGLPNVAAAPTIPVGAVATANLSGGYLASVSLSNITTTPYTSAPYFPIDYVGALPNVQGVLNASNQLTGANVIGGGQGFNPQTPMGITVPAPTSQTPTANATLALNFGVASIQGIDPDSGFTAGNPPVVSLSGGSPTTAAVLGTPVIAPIDPAASASVNPGYTNPYASANEPLITTIPAGQVGSTIQMTDPAQQTLTAQAELVFWGHDDGPAIQAAWNSGLNVLAPSGHFWTSTKLVPAPGMHWNGQSRYLTEISLMPGVDDDMVQTPNFYSVFPQNASNSNAGAPTDNIEIGNTAFDGNWQAQDVINPARQNGLVVYGSAMNVHDNFWSGMVGNMWITDYLVNAGAGGGSFTNNFTPVGSYGCGRTGWLDHGPHDQNGSQSNFIDCSQRGDNAWPGIETYGGASGTHLFDHPWHTGGATNRVSWGLLDQTSVMRFQTSDFEGGRGNVYLAAGGTSNTSNYLYANYGGPGSAELVLAGSGTVIDGMSISVDNFSPKYAIQYGVPFYPASHTQAALVSLSGFGYITPFNFANDGGGNTLTGSGSAGGSALFTTPGGTQAASDCMTYSQTGPAFTLACPIGSIAQVANGSVANGNSRGANAADFQSLRNQASQIASGSASVVSGGSQNTASGANSTVTGGNSNVASAQYASVSGGYFNTADGVGSSARGINVAARGRYGVACTASNGFALSGDAQECDHVLRATATGTTVARLTADGAAAGSANCVNLPAFSSYAVRVTMEARDQQNSSNRFTATWTAAHDIFQVNAPSATFVDGSQTATVAPDASRGITGAAATISADTTNGCLAVNFTPPSGNADTYHVVAHVVTTETQ